MRYWINRKAGSLVLGLLLVGGLFTPALADRDDWDKDRKRARKGWEKRYERDREWREDQRRAIRRVLLEERYRDLLRNRYVGYTRYQDLPPGIRKQLARGKRLPPGIAKQMVVMPNDFYYGMSRDLRMPRYDYARAGIYGDDIYVYNPKTGMIMDVIRGILTGLVL